MESRTRARALTKLDPNKSSLTTRVERVVRFQLLSVKSTDTLQHLYNNKLHLPNRTDLVLVSLCMIWHYLALNPIVVYARSTFIAGMSNL